MILQNIIGLFYIIFFQIDPARSSRVTCIPKSEQPLSSRSELDALRWAVDRICHHLITQTPYQYDEFEFAISPPAGNTKTCAASFNAILSSCTRAPQNFRGGWVVNEANYSISYKSLWDINIEKAIPRCRALQNKLSTPALRIDKPIPSGLSERWRTTQSTVRASEHLITVMKKVPGYIGSPSLTQIYTDSIGDGHYKNAFDPHGRLISAMSNYANTHPIPALKGDKWSDIIFAQWTRLCQTTGTDPSQLKWIVRNNVRNPHTQKILDKALGGVTQRTLRWFAGTDPDPSAFFALSMTPNVLGAFWMAFDFPGSLGLFVKRIGVLDVVGQEQGFRIHTFLVVEFEGFVARNLVT